MVKPHSPIAEARARIDHSVVNKLNVQEFPSITSETRITDQMPKSRSPLSTCAGVIEDTCLLKQFSEDKIGHLSPLAQRQIKVKFCSKVAVREITSKESISEKRREKIWYTPKDIEILRAHINDTLSILETEKVSLDDEHYCARGLELKMSESFERRNRAKIAVKRLVFSLQDAQRKSGIRNEQAIADVAATKTAISAREAYLWAMADAKFAALYLSS